jgi:hypothetical protein
MADEQEKLSGAEEYIAVEIELAEALNPEQEKNLRDALGKIDSQAFDSCDIDPKQISFCYDPTRTTKKVLLAAIARAGGKLAHIESGGSPLLETDSSLFQPQRPSTISREGKAT